MSLFYKKSIKSTFFEYMSLFLILKKYYQFL